jgi:hypothetical protein
MSRPTCGAFRRRLKTGRDSVWTRLSSAYQLKPNNDACSGTADLPRDLLPDSYARRCPKTKTELPAMASSTTAAGSS